MMDIFVNVWCWLSQWFTIFTWRLKIEKANKLVANLHDKTEYGIHIRNLKQALNNESVLKKFPEWLKIIKMLG